MPIFQGFERVGRKNGFVGNGSWMREDGEEDGGGFWGDERRRRGRGP